MSLNNRIQTAWLALLLLTLCVNSQAYAIVVVDDLGQRLELDKPVETIIALSPHLTELVFEAGAGEKLVATVEYADFPEAARSITRVGSYNTWDIEKIMTMKPDVVLVWLSANGIAAVERLRQLGFKVYVSEPRAFDDISRTIRDIGRMAGVADMAELKALHFEKVIAGLAEKYRNAKKIRLFYQVWSRPLVTVNGQQLISQVFDLCGGENVFAALPALAPVISTEALLLENPDVIIGSAGQQEKRQWLKQWRNWPSMKAVKNDNLFLVEPDVLARQSSRMLQGARQVCEILQQVRNRRMKND